MNPLYFSPMMRGLILLWAISMAGAQSSTAPPGYYPRAFNGDVFNGTVSAVGQNTITLTFHDGSATKTFLGRFDSTCIVPEGKDQSKPMLATDIPIGSELKAYYYPNTVKVAGKKTKENVIIGISISRWKDQTFPVQRQGMIFCTSDKLFPLHAF
ncbi:MAG TPA: hypothetical protein VG893_02970 [Terracidiphilus sp.]|nr:hypothetical protein [Terracidiphilus sp.]